MNAHRAIAAAFAAVAVLCAHGQLVRENEQPIERLGPVDLAGGLVLDATVTVLGHEFFTAFADAWRDLDGLQRYSVTVHEMPTARFGSTIRIQSQGRTVYQALLGPNRQAAREFAQNLAGDIFQQLLRTEAEQALTRDLDLGPEELQ